MRYVLSNWKMYPSRERSMELFTAVQAGLAERSGADRAVLRVILCPPFLSLPQISGVLDPGLVRLGAQNCHWEREGPYTGETSATMLKGLVDYVLIGHSERRAAGESDDQIAGKVSAAVEAGLVPILFVGEDEPTQDAIEQTERRLKRGLARVDLARDEALVAYEPTWAIGAEQSARADHVRRVVEQLKSWLEDLGAGEPRVIYGGTVNGDNVEAFASIEILDGVGATRAGLDAGEFLRVVDRMARAGAPGPADG